MDPSASTGLKNSISSAYSLESDLPVNLSVVFWRLMVSSFTSGVYFFRLRDDG